MKNHQKIRLKLINQLQGKRENKTQEKLKFIINKIIKFNKIIIPSKQLKLKPQEKLLLLTKIQYIMLFMMQKLIKQNNYRNIKVHQRAKAFMKMKIKY